MEDHNHNSLRDRVLNTIQAGHTKMKPKWHFVLKAALFLLGFFLLFFAALYLVSFALFVLDKNQLWSVSTFGMRGISLFLVSLPWLVIFTVIIFLILLHFLVRHYAFAYQRPLLYSALGIVLLVTVGSCIIRKTGFHQGVSDYSRAHRMPVAFPLYQRFEFQKNDHIYPGIIIEIRDPNFLLEDRWQQILEVRVTTYTRFPKGSKLVIGDEVMVLGDRQGKVIEAFGIRKIGPGHPFPPTLRERR